MPPRLSRTRSPGLSSQSTDPDLRDGKSSSRSNKASSSSVTMSALPFSISNLHVLVVALLAMAVAAASSISLLSSSSPSISPRSCIPHDQPNPIANVYPNNATGLLNVTLAIVPIPLATARAIIPSKWPILEHVFRALFESTSTPFPPDHYPLLVQAGLDHDIQLTAYNLSIPDFQKFGYEFPFVDRLGDNRTSFRWVPSQIISAGNADAVQGSEEYGTVVARGDAFDPPCDAYGGGGGLPPGSARSGPGATYFKASSSSSKASAEIAFHALAAHPHPPYPLDLFRNVTNQPSFANGTTCDNQIRLFDPAYFFGQPFAPRPVQGTVRTVNLPPLNGVQEFAAGVYGWQLATAFIENNYLDCESLRGYDGVALPGY